MEGFRDDNKINVFLKINDFRGYQRQKVVQPVVQKVVLLFKSS